MQKTVRFLDTTLRDGEQTPGVSFHLNEKVEFAKALEALGGREPQNLEEQALTLVGRDIFGILIKGTIGRVGSDTHYVEYDLTSGAISHIVKDGERINYSTSQAEASPYRFVRINYEGGDYYIGETYNGRRHGLGIYHWSNGNHWYGTFNNDYRQGYGALFCTDGTIDHGLWLGNDKQ